MKTNIIIGLYVDDVIVTGGFSVVEEFISMFQKKYKSRCYEEVHDFIGCELIWNEDHSSIILHQTQMIHKLEKS